MFEVEPMAKVRVLCAKNDLDGVVERLYSFGAIHVTRSKAFSPGSPSPKLESVSGMLVKLRAVESTLAGFKKKTAYSTSGLSGSALHDLQKEFSLLPLLEFDLLEGKKRELEARLNEFYSRKKELKAFQNVDLDLGKLSSKTTLVEFAVFEITGGKEKALNAAREFGQAASIGFGNQEKILVALEKRNAEKARQSLNAFAREIPLPEAKQSFAQEYNVAEKGLFETQKQLAEVERALGLYAFKHGGKIVLLRNAFETEFKKSELPSKFGLSELSASAEGWIPEKLYGKLEYSVSEKLGEKVFLEKIDTGETPPSKLKRLPVLSPFGFLIEFFSLPRYEELDPTFFTALTFPLFFGMILGDVGYGAILLAIGLFLSFKARKGFFSKIGGMMTLSALSTVIFGFIYAEAFGAESILGFELHPLLSRVHETGIETLFALSILIGFLHLTLGFLLGAWQGLREKHSKHAFAKISGVLVLWGFTAFLTNSMGLVFTNLLGFLKFVLPSPLDLAAFMAGVAGLVYFEGAVQLVELPSLFVNVLSYLRLMALGLSAAALGGIVASIKIDFSSIASLNPGAWISFLLMLLLVVLGHAVAIALGVLEAGIQSLRLHYVEFYSKFYKGGGIPFIPLRED